MQVRAGKGSCCSPPHTVWMIRGAEYVGARGERGGCERSERRVSGSPRSQPWSTSKRNRIVCGPESRTVVALSTSPPPLVSRSPCRQPYRVTVRTGTGVIDWDYSLSPQPHARQYSPRRRRRMALSRMWVCLLPIQFPKKKHHRATQSEVIERTRGDWYCYFFHRRRGEE